MATLICTQYPRLGIFVPETGEWMYFEGGRLDVEEDHPYYDVVMTEAARNPAIVVYAGVKTCVYCGDVEKSAAALTSHVKEAHFDKWIADQDAEHSESRNVEVKSRAGGFYCDVCQPAGEFASEEELALHASVMHAAAPDLTADGSDAAPRGGKGKKSGEVEAIPAATAK